jgi:hydrogenase maturation protease
VAGVGNIFLSDDGFGPEVARQLAATELPAGVVVVDYGIRGMHLAFDLLDGWDGLVVLDAIASQGAPGTVHLIEVETSGQTGHFDAHGMDPAAMLAGVAALGGQLPPTYLLGCEAAELSEGIGLSEPVAGAAKATCPAVLDLIGRFFSPAIEPAVG